MLVIKDRIRKEPKWLEKQLLCIFLYKGGDEEIAKCIEYLIKISKPPPIFFRDFCKFINNIIEKKTFTGSSIKLLIHSNNCGHDYKKENVVSKLKNKPEN